MDDITPAHAVPLHYQSLGAGHPLIILHGLFGSSANWKPLGRSLSESYHVLVVDLRNHGRSPHHDVINYPVMAADIDALMQAQNLASAYLMGHSMGGKVAMQFALNYPDKVDKLIVVDIVPKAYAPRHHQIFEALRAVDLDTIKSRDELSARLAPQVPDVALRQFLLMNAMPAANGYLRWRLNLDALYRNYDELNRGLEATTPFNKPTLFIKGEKSDYIQAADEAGIKRLFPLAQIVTIPAAGHWVQAEAPAEFIKFVSSFLGDG